MSPFVKFNMTIAGLFYSSRLQTHKGMQTTYHITVLHQNQGNYTRSIHFAKISNTREKEKNYI